MLELGETEALGLEPICKVTSSTCSTGSTEGETDEEGEIEGDSELEGEIEGESLEEGEILADGETDGL